MYPSRMRPLFSILAWVRSRILFSYKNQSLILREFTIQITKVTTLILIQMTAMMRRNYPHSKRWRNTDTVRVRHGSFEKKNLSETSWERKRIKKIKVQRVRLLVWHNMQINPSKYYFRCSKGCVCVWLLNKLFFIYVCLYKNKVFM